MVIENRKTRSLKKKFDELSKKNKMYQEMFAKIKQEKKLLERDLARENDLLLVNKIKEADFSLDNDAILIGALLYCKEQMKTNKTAFINTCTTFYSKFQSSLAEENKEVANE